MPVAVVAIAVGVVAVAVVDDEDGVQWQWTMKMAFNDAGSVGEAMQQSVSMMRGQEGSATIG
jgi:hypothetical protein